MAEIGAETAAELLVEEWKYRHDVYWKFYVRWGTAILFLLSVPWIAPPPFLDDIGDYIIVIPMTAAILVGLSTWHIYEEYTRTKTVYAVLRRLRSPEYETTYTRRRKPGKVPTIAAVAVVAYAFLLGVLTLIAGGMLRGWLGLLGVMTILVFFWAYTWRHRFQAEPAAGVKPRSPEQCRG